MQRMVCKQESKNEMRTERIKWNDYESQWWAMDVLSEHLNGRILNESVRKTSQWNCKSEELWHESVSSVLWWKEIFCIACEVHQNILKYKIELGCKSFPPNFFLLIMLE